MASFRISCTFHFLASRHLSIGVYVISFPSTVTVTETFVPKCARRGIILKSLRMLFDSDFGVIRYCTDRIKLQRARGKCGAGDLI